VDCDLKELWVITTEEIWGKVNINYISKSWRSICFHQSEGPGCNCFRTTTTNSFGTTRVATQQQLLTYCPSRLTRFSVQYRPSWKMSDRAPDAVWFHLLWFVSMSSS